MAKSVKWFENPEDASHLALEMDGNEAVKLEQSAGILVRA